MVTIEVYDCERRARTVAAIKYVRQLRGLTLSEALHRINEVYYHSQPVTFDFAYEPLAWVFVDTLASFGFRCRLVLADRKDTSQGVVE